MFLRREDAAPGGFDDVAAVAPASDFKVRSTYRVQMKLRQKARIAVQLGVLQNAGEMRIGDDLLFNLVAPIRVGVQDAIGERIGPGALHAGVKMALFFMEESLAIGDEILQVANLRAVKGGVIGFGDDAIPKSEPEAAGGGIGGPHAVLGSIRPSRCNAWFAESGSIAAKLCHWAPAPRI